jgi:hypothetical protein
MDDNEKTENPIFQSQEEMEKWVKSIEARVAALEALEAKLRRIAEQLPFLQA